jgi:PKD repeat protein
VTGARQDASIALAGCDTAAVPAPVFPTGTDLGDFAELVLDCDFTPITPIIGNVFSGNPLTVTARSVFPIRIGAVDGPPINPAPVCLASFAWDVDDADPLTVSFTDTTTGGSGPYLWDFGDARASTLQDPTHTYNAGGTYQVIFRVSGCSPSQLNVTVTEPPPTPDPSASAGPSASPSASPSATPDPTCTVPAFIGSKKNNAAATWAAAGFTTAIIFSPNPNGNWTIQAQSAVGGFEQACNAPITLGPDPLPSP